jgi:transcriptional regulator
MYQPPHFQEDDPAVQHALIRSHPLGLLVTKGAAELHANLIPFVLDASAGEHGLLRGHLARPNPQWQDLDPAFEALVVFQGAEAYITPSWYAAKQETGKVVPTWNYAVVQVHGRIGVIEDEAWLRRQIEALTAHQESSRAVPWRVADAPPNYVAGQLRGIVGVEIAITRIDGKWKASQNRPAVDIPGVVDGLKADAQAEMAELVAGRNRGR